MEVLADLRDFAAEIPKLLGGFVPYPFVTSDAASDLLDGGLKVAELLAHGPQIRALSGFQIRQEPPQPAAGGQRVGDFQQFDRFENRLFFAEFLQERANVPESRHGYSFSSLQDFRQLRRFRHTGSRPAQVYRRIQAPGGVLAQIAGRIGREDPPDFLEFEHLQGVFVYSFAGHARFSMKRMR